MVDDAERKIIMAVDFGTTYSGLAWAQTRKPEIQQAVIHELQYDDEGYKWGFQIDDFGPRHQWFKLLLDPSQSRNTTGLSSKYPDSTGGMPAYEQGPEKLVKDYSTALRIHAERVLRNKLPQSALTSIPIEFVITVPAVWSDRAQASTRRCAEQAGMGTGSSLHVISEPEAAAMYALDAMDPHNIKVGDTFVLCDAGGGTVDLISYKVSALKPALQIAEAAPGSGSLCGSTFLNRIFKKFLTDRFGDDPNFDEDVLEEAMKRFEVMVKRSFNGNTDKEYQIPGSDVKAIFEPVIQEILDLVNGQINVTKAQVKAVLLVGGFGQSVYLRDSIRQAVTGQGIEVMQSPNGLWYGFQGAYYINTMEWFIQKGETVEEAKPKRLFYYRTLRADALPPSMFELQIYMCSDNGNAGPPKYRDERVQGLVNVQADMSRIEPHLFPKVFGSDGYLYYKIDFAVEITFYSAYTKYELIYNNVNYGPITAEYV
ncbi:MAG: hypothetical protein Q9168_001910 [Polycauliona sp. 1 TL-2023]